MIIVYDFECYPSDWMVVLASASTKSFETIINDVDRLREFYEEHKDDIWVGYNNKNYDQYILKGILLGFDPYDISSYIIEGNNRGYTYSKAFNQIKLNNFDVMVFGKSLKQLEGFMGSSIKESSVSFNHQGKLSNEQLKEVEKYCRHDVEQTLEVFINSIDEFNAHLMLIKEFKLPIEYIGKTKPQLAAVILNAKRVYGRNDEFNVTFPDTLKLSKYKYVLDWYKDNLDYKNELATDIAGVKHIFKFGGLHGAISKYYGVGNYVLLDVALI